MKVTYAGEAAAGLGDKALPIPLAVRARKKLDPRGWIWNSVLASTGQPADLT